MSDMHYEFEPSAREIAGTVLGRANARIPRDILPLVTELIVDAAHEGIEFGEALAALPEHKPTALEHYHKGYMNAIDDLEEGVL